MINNPSLDSVRLLIVEDDKAIADTLAYTLQAEHYQTQWVSNGETAIEQLKNNHFDGVILDIGLPDINGFDVLKTVRQFSDIPVLFLTARNEEIDLILGLEMGADDYITKPFSPREVATRIKVILRRLHPPATPEATHGFHLNEQTATVTLLGRALVLTKAEYLLLKTLLGQPQRVFSRTQLISAVWSDNHPSDERAIDTHIKTLRAKIRAIDAEKSYIHTHRGLGYSLRF